MPTQPVVHNNAQPLLVHNTNRTLITETVRNVERVESSIVHSVPKYNMSNEVKVAFEFANTQVTFAKDFNCRARVGECLALFNAFLSTELNSNAAHYKQQLPQLFRRDTAEVAKLEYYLRTPSLLQLSTHESKSWKDFDVGREATVQIRCRQVFTLDTEGESEEDKMTHALLPQFAEGYS